MGEVAIGGKSTKARVVLRRGLATVVRMAENSSIDVAQFSDAFVQLSEAVRRAAPRPEAPFVGILRDHLDQNPGELPVVATTVASYEHATLQLALDAFLAEPDVELDRQVGIRGESRQHGDSSLSGLTLDRAYGSPEPGPVDFVELPVDVDRSLTCIDFGLLLVRVAGEAFAMLVRTSDPRQGVALVKVEAMGTGREAASGVLRRLRNLMASNHAFRERVIALTPVQGFGAGLRTDFLARPQLARTDVILQEPILERVERLTLLFSERAESMRAGGRHLRRGLLLHGPPGTGKTHTVRYLMSRLTDRTVFILSGQGLSAIGASVSLARRLQPAIVVLEDVDLVAEERTRPHAGTNPVLFELLNQMDGVEEDADIVFILTTNRPDLLEPALASRPGRVDVAIEIPLPSPAERRRLLELYARGLEVDAVDWQPVVAATSGASPAYLRELLRRAALQGADGTGPPRIGQAEVGTALEEMAEARDALMATAPAASTNQPSG